MDILEEFSHFLEKCIDVFLSWDKLEFHVDEVLPIYSIGVSMWVRL